MKTNSNISNSENAGQAAKRIYKISTSDIHPAPKRDAFIVGANWQKEQYKDLVSSHTELLEALKTCYISLQTYGHHPLVSIQVNSAIENAKKKIQ